MFLAASLALCWLCTAAQAAPAQHSVLWRSPEAVAFAAAGAPAWSGSPMLAPFRQQGEAPASATPSRTSRLRPSLYWSAGLALAAGTTAWWSARRADQAYGRYLHAAGPRRQERELRRAERGDRIAGMAFGFMEAGIVLSTYLVFF